MQLMKIAQATVPFMLPRKFEACVETCKAFVWRNERPRFALFCEEFRFNAQQEKIDVCRSQNIKRVIF
jgi:hypothetical protein